MLSARENESVTKEVIVIDVVAEVVYGDDDVGVVVNDGDTEGEQIRVPMGLSEGVYVKVDVWNKDGECV